MTINSFVSQYELHDSLLDKVTVDTESQKVILLVDFCYWMQKGYTNQQPETGMVNIIFNDATFINGPIGECNSFSILRCIASSNGVLIVLLDDDTDEYFELTIAAT